MWSASMEILENLANAKTASVSRHIDIKTMEGIKEDVCVEPAAICLQVKTLMLR